MNKERKCIQHGGTSGFKMQLSQRDYLGNKGNLVKQKEEKENHVGIKRRVKDMEIPIEEGL